MLIRSLAVVSVLALAACSGEATTQDAPVDSETAATAGETTDEAAVTPASDAPDGERTPPRPTDPTQTHCAQGERAFYNCPFGDGRIVSVCIGDETSYRFGPPNAPELNITVAPGQGGVWRVDGRDGGPSTYFRFERGEYNYVVYSGRSGEPLVERSGVAVLRDGELIQRLECPVTSTQTEIPVTMIPTYIPRDPDTVRDGRW